VDPNYRSMTNPAGTFCSVAFRDSNGVRWMTNASGTSAFEAARAALAFFADPYWKGPKPQPDTVMEVSPMGRQDCVRVKVSRLLEKGKG
jgi:hypothetical protein